MAFYTDGSAHPNPGAGGFGVIQTNENNEIIFAYTEQSEHTTNNREELKAILYVMEHYGNNFETPEVYSDSGYSVNTLTNWMFNWAERNWIKSNKSIPENLDLVKFYYNLYQKGYRVNLNLIKGHNGDKFNDMADLLATGKKTPEQIMKMEENDDTK